MVRSYLDFTIKFHDYSSFITAFDVATCRLYEGLYQIRDAMAISMIFPSIWKGCETLFV